MKRNKGEKKLILLIVLFSILLFPTKGQAMEVDRTPILQKFLHEFVSSDCKVIKNKYGEKVPYLIEQEVIDLAEKREYKSLKHILIKNNLIISYNEIRKIDNELVYPSSYPIESGRITERAYHVEVGTWRGRTVDFEKQWITILTADYRFDPNTNKILNISSPRENFDTTFGIMFSPYQTNVRTNSNCYRNTYNLSVSYDMWATIGVDIGNIPAGINVNYGHHDDRFSGAF